MTKNQKRTTSLITQGKKRKYVRGGHREWV